MRGFKDLEEAHEEARVIGGGDVVQEWINLGMDPDEMLRWLGGYWRAVRSEMLNTLQQYGLVEGTELNTMTCLCIGVQIGMILERRKGVSDAGQDQSGER